MRSALVLFALLLAACAAPAPASAPPPRLVQTAPSDDLAPGQDEVSMEIVELMCRPCASQIVEQTEHLAGVTSVHLMLATKTLTLRFDTALTRKDAIIASVEHIVASIQ